MRDRLSLYVAADPGFRKATEAEILHALAARPRLLADLRAMMIAGAAARLAAEPYNPAPRRRRPLRAAARALLEELTR